MIVTADSLLHLLLDRGFVLREAAVDGDVITAPGPAPGWFRLMEGERAQFFACSGEAVARERMLFKRLGGLGLLPALRIDEPDVLVFETFPRAYDVVELHRTSKRVAEWLPAVVGRALAAVHGTPVDDGVVPRTLPAMLLPTDATRRAPLVAQAVAQVAGRWQGNALIHGKAGFDRIFVASDTDPRIHLVGWDEARAGDPAWDAGAVIESYYAWALDPSFVKDVEGPVCPLSVPAMQGAIMSFWSAYGAGLVPAEAHARLVRAFGYAGVMMIDRIDRMLRKPDNVQRQLTQMTQAAIALMTAPAAAATAFFTPPQPAWAQQPWGRS
jgi:hypothetical protein